MLNNGRDIAHVVGSVVDGRLEGLESHENLSLHLDSLWVVVLIPDLFILIEFIDLFIKVSTWECIIAIILRIIRPLIFVSDIEVGLSTSLLLDLLLIGREICGVCCERTYGKSDSKFHNFILRVNEYIGLLFWKFNDYIR